MLNLQGFAERLKELMFDFDVNAPSLAQAIGCDSSTINGLERGAHYPSTQVLISLAQFFNCSADFLLGRTDIDEGARKQVKPFGQIFRNLMKKSYVSQYRLNKDLKISANSIYKWLHDEAMPNVESLVKLAEYFDCSVDFLLGWED